MEHLKLGILGGGQLGRMSAMAAARLGISVVIFTPEKDSPASQVVEKTIIAEYEDETALKAFAEEVDVISYEFENIPVKTIRYLKSLKPVYPDDTLLNISQDRSKEKTFLNNQGIQTAKWTEVTSERDVEKFLEDTGSNECIIKTRRFGYDGKGQSKCSADNISETLRMFKGHDLIAEDIVDFDCEVSVIIARDIQGNTAHYGPMLNEHEDHILSKTIVPANISTDLTKQSVQIVEKLARAFNLIGVMTLEMFITKDGKILANEIAPRTHNSGHWSIDACGVSQFEQHVRTVCKLPVGAVKRHSDAEMINLVGRNVSKAENYLSQENACVHLYGKQDIRDGRKMGHITILKDKT